MAKKTATKTKKTNLIIVESPAKAKTIEKYLGNGYTVKASMGHLIDLPKSRIARISTRIYHRTRPRKTFEGTATRCKERQARLSRK